jgi:hypothetical protein
MGWFIKDLMLVLEVQLPDTPVSLKCNDLSPDTENTPCVFVVGDNDMPLSRERIKFIHVANFLRNDEILKAR